MLLSHLCHLGYYCPVFLVVTTHYAGDHHLTKRRVEGYFSNARHLPGMGCDVAWLDTDIVGEVPLQLSYWLAPVGCCLLTDELDVEEGALARAKHMAWGGATHNTRWHVRHQVLQRDRFTQIMKIDKFLYYWTPYWTLPKWQIMTTWNRENSL